MNRIYFDNAATTALDPQVLEAMMPYLTDKFGNPSSIYSYGRETRMAIEAARKSVAKILNAHPAEIFFTSGGTESSNTAITASVRDLGCKHIITSPIEHHAVSHSVEYLDNMDVAKVSLVKLLPNGHIDLDDLERLLAASEEKTLVTLMHANNEIGNILDIHAVGRLCKLYNAIFHSDTVQTVGHFPFDLRNTPVHFITGAAHKFHGPKGVGILYINENVKIKPFVHGGAQERNMRAGTENLYGIVGFAKALELATANYEEDSAHIGTLKYYMMDELKKHIKGVGFNGDTLGSLMRGCGLTPRHLECSFPIEMFLLFGDNYIGNSALGRASHEKRMNFETALHDSGRQQLLSDLYRKFGELGIGRILSVFAVKEQGAN